MQRQKVIQLEQQYSQLLGPQLLGFTPTEAVSIATTAKKTVQSRTLTTTTTTTTSSTSHCLDFAATLKAAQAISTEIELDKLTTTLMKIVIISAGAQTGCLILHQGRKWIVRAQTNSEAVEAVEVVETVEIPVEQASNLPQSLIYSVARTGKAAIFLTISALGSSKTIPTSGFSNPFQFYVCRSAFRVSS